MLSIEEIIQKLGLQPLPGEGGLYAETYRSTIQIPAHLLPASYPVSHKPAGTAIFYLLTHHPDSFSALHRLPTDEVYHFYLGDPLELCLLRPDGSSRQIWLGQDILHDQYLQFVVPAHTWQGSRVAAGGSYSLVGTTMAPGFTPDDYEPGQRDSLLAQYPLAGELIRSLTRPPSPAHSDQK